MHPAGRFSIGLREVRVTAQKGRLKIGLPDAIRPHIGSPKTGALSLGAAAKNGRATSSEVPQGIEAAIYRPCMGAELEELTARGRFVSQFFVRRAWCL